MNHKFVDTKVTYHIDVHGSLIVVENVPARLDLDTGQAPSSPRTMGRLHEMIRKQSRPSRVLQTMGHDHA